MKGIKWIVVFAVIVLLSVSWYSLFENSYASQKEYDDYLKVARSKAEMGIITDADFNYNEALKLLETIELRSEIAEFYKTSNQEYKLRRWAEAMIQEYPYEPIGYEYLATYYKDKSKYYDCFSILNKASKRRIASSILENLHEELAYAYELNWEVYEDVALFSSGYCAVLNKDGEWGYINEKGSKSINDSYLDAQPFTTSGYAPVQSMTGEYYIVNTAGDKKFIDAEKKEIENCGPYAEEKMSVKIHGKYQYVDIEFKILFGSYDYAGTFNCGVAGVREGDTWKIIDGKGNPITEETFEDVKLDEKGIAFRNDVGFVKKNGQYILINKNGDQISENTWDDVQVFASNMPTAVKVNDKWGYIDTLGEEVISPQYKNARPFVNELAAVAQEDKWGYITVNNELVIPVEFNDTRDFTSSGTTLIKDDRGWRLLKIYRLNTD